MEGQVLVLNGDYQPLNVTNARRGLGLVLRGKAQVLERSEAVIASACDEFPFPSVIKLEYFVRRPRQSVKLSRKAIFARDSHRCQYCGQDRPPLTIDHVVPRSRGGASSWENLVTACKLCNNRKGGRTVEQSGMLPRRTPSQPRFILPNYYASMMHRDIDEQWLKYLSYYLPRQ